MADSLAEVSCLGWSSEALAIGTSGAGVALCSRAGVSLLKAPGMRLVRTISLSDDGGLVLVGKSDTKATLLDTGGKATVLSGKGIGAASLVSLLGDGSLALHARFLFDRRGTAISKKVFGYRSAFAARGELIIAVEDAELWRMDRRGEILQAITLPQQAECVAVANDADACAIGTKCIVDGTDVREVGKLMLFHGATSKTLDVLDEYDVSSVAISRDGSVVAAGGYVKSSGPVGGVRIFRRGKPDRGVLPFAPPVSGNGIAISSKADRVAAIIPGNLVRITDLESTSRFWELSVRDAAAWCIRAWDGRIEGQGKHGLSGKPATGVLAEALG